MSKKTRKKSSNTTGKRAATKIARGAGTSTRKSAAKSRTAVAKAKKAKQPVKTRSAAAVRSKASHTATSKPLSAKPAAAKSAGAILAEGAMAPAFTLPRDGGESVSLSDFAGKKLVLFFYPRADTPGCTKEAIDFTRLKNAFAAAGTEVLGISADTVKAQESFRNKHQLSVPLISDEQHQMLETYGVWGEKSLYGRTFMGIIRTTVLVDSDGKVARVWRHVKVDGHAEAVLEAARSL
ncbi:thioredoxin-dependent thiol peroxidase [Bradyrhizobium sp. CCBAU 51753]|uniref:thioredoxin-dependent thiol peroxidase n=1 Tax=Bradyrhizobium sp. CCBAU 51753 TaxID=1325100 RepID=UPI00188DC23A|nr:thioredoxin-dependent thiol peroxidase [Bradyrhizobium sp. CCBAU 51753]QOZ25712.1 thioredoxin-dependent thiol peroxidase [Bradyrhizobium sp. CCBAU 51753]